MGTAITALTAAIQGIFGLVKLARENLVTTLVVIILLLGGGMFYLQMPHKVQQCVSIPATGHVIDTAAPGEWATVTWHDLRRFKDCSKPELTGVVVNGDGIYHDVEMTTKGVKLDVGVVPELRYKFLVPETAKPGRAWFRVTVNFPKEGQSVDSPRIHFIIKEKSDD